MTAKVLAHIVVQQVAIVIRPKMDVKIIVQVLAMELEDEQKIIV